MSDYFLLDPDYKDFPEKQKLKFLTVYGEQHTFIALAVLSLIFGSVMISSTFKWLPLEWSYLTIGHQAEAVVTVSCQSSEEQYAYSFTGIDSNGQTHQYTGSGKSAKDKPCPKLNSRITVEYLSDQPELTARDRESPLSNSGSWGLIIIFSLGFIKIGLGAVWAFLKAIPKFVRLQRATTILEGQVLSAKEAGFTFQMRVRNGHYIEVVYEFMANNSTFRHKQVKRREDLSSGLFPQRGTPIYVLYADENTYVML